MLSGNSNDATVIASSLSVDVVGGTSGPHAASHNTIDTIPTARVPTVLARGDRRVRVRGILGVLASPPRCRAPDEVRDRAEGDLDAVGENAEQQDGRDHLRATPAGRDESTDVAELHYAETAGRQRQRGEQPSEREHREDLEGGDLGFGDAHVPKSEE